VWLSSFAPHILLCSALRVFLLRAIGLLAVGYVLEGGMDSGGKFAEVVVLLVARCEVVKVSERVEHSMDDTVMVEVDTVAVEVGTVVIEAAHIAVIEAGAESEVVDNETAQSDTAVAIPKVNLFDTRPAGVLDSFLVHKTQTLSAFVAAVTEPASYTPLPPYQQNPLTKPLYHFFSTEHHNVRGMRDLDCLNTLPTSDVGGLQ
jgi:hypothetical protein